jgi:hypothetical protein
MSRFVRPAAVLAALLLLPLGVLAAQSQEAHKEKKLWVTLSGGATFSKFTGADADTANLDTRVGYSAGGALSYQFSPRFGLAFEAGVLQGGAKQLEVSRDPGLGYTLTYFQLGLSAEFNLAPGASVQPVLHAGPTLAFEIDCMQPILYNQVSVLQSNCLDEPERESTEFGGQAGLALRWKMLVLDARYERAFASLLPEGDLTNQGLLVTLGVRF